MIDTKIDPCQLRRTATDLSWAQWLLEKAADELDRLYLIEKVAKEVAARLEHMHKCLSVPGGVTSMERCLPDEIAKLRGVK